MNHKIMYRLIISLSLLLACLGVNAQATSLSGTFKEPLIAGRMCPVIALFAPDGGHMKQIAEIPVNKPDYQYQIDFSDKKDLLNTLLFVGYKGEFFPFYLKAGEHLQLDITNSTATYGKKLSKENKVLADWVRTVAPLHHLGLDKAVTNAPADSVVTIMDKAWKESEKIVKKIKTGNKSFDEFMRLTLPYEFMYEALQVFGMGWCAPSIDKMPQYIQHIFRSDNFNSPKVWEVPFASETILWLTFAKDICCEMKLGQTINYAIANISDPVVKEEYAMYSLENNLVPNKMEFLNKFESIFTKDAYKKRIAEIKQQCAIVTPGNNWIDMEYEDKDGKMHKLSEHLGKVVVIDVWATWCMPCKKELPHLVQLEKELEGKDVVFIGYSIDEDKEAWKNWITTHEMSKVQLWTGRKGPIVDDYQVMAVPQFIVFSKTGKLVSLNAPRPSEPALKELIEKELAK